MKSSHIVLIYPFCFCVILLIDIVLHIFDSLHCPLLFVYFFPFAQVVVFRSDSFLSTRNETMPFFSFLMFRVEINSVFLVLMSVIV